jgi:MFS transporter, SP family, arabinose:H+ symporter
VGFFQFNVVFGIMLAYLSNYAIGLLKLGEIEWRGKLGVAALPAALFLWMLFRIPRSPRWLAEKHRLDEARAVLCVISSEDPGQELRSILESINSESKSASSLFVWKYRLPIFLAVSIGMFNQLAGINAILYYLNDIFARAGFSKVSGDLQSVAVGITFLASTVIAMLFIDKLGRKKLLLIGSICTSACLIGVAAIFFTDRHQRLLLPFLIGYIAFFAFSQGAVIWVYISEVFPTQVRAKGQSLGSFSHWFMNAIISAIFPLMAASSSGYPFVFFAGMMVLQFLIVLFIYPETKGIPLEDIHRALGIN